MQTYLPFRVGQCSHTSEGGENVDWFDFKIPQGQEIFSKGGGFALACDANKPTGSRETAQTVVRSFLLDYFSTPDNWSPDEAARRVLRAANGWLHAQTQYGMFGGREGFHCKFSGLILRESRAFFINVGKVPMFLLRARDLHDRCFDDVPDKPLGSSPICFVDIYEEPVASGDVIVITNQTVASAIDQETMRSVLLKRDDDLNHTAFALVREAEKKSQGTMFSAAVIEVK